MSLFEPIFHDERTLEKLQDALHKVILERDALKRENEMLRKQIEAWETQSVPGVHFLPGG